MKLLLDTNAFLWWLADPALLKDKARFAIANPQNFVFLSSVSVIEMAIKEGKGKLSSATPPENEMRACNFRELPFTIAHASALRALPPIHHDPFDRMLVAQAHVESMTLVTRDRLLAQYPISAIAA